MERWIDQVDLARMTGIVIPAYFSAKPSDELVSHLLWMTLGDCPAYLPLDHICVVVDGDPRTERLLVQLRDAMLAQHGATFHILSLLENRGKLWAIKAGVSLLLEANPALTYFTIRDGDGDHAIAEVPALVRAALHLTDAYGHSNVIVIGARRSRHHPMGWLRGEMETLLDWVNLDALAYTLARQGRALDLAHCVGRGAVPDLSSGFKVYGRQIAEELFVRQEPSYASLTPNDYWHYGPETATITEAMLTGAVIAEKLRLTWDGQPTTSFGEFKQLTLYGELLAWVFARLEIPVAVAAQLYDNHAPDSMLRTTAQGIEMLAALRRYALEKTAAWRGDRKPIPDAKPPMPFM